MNKALRVLEVVQSLERGGRTVRFIATVEGLRERACYVLPVTFKQPTLPSCSTKGLLIITSEYFNGLHKLYKFIKLIKKHRINLVHCHCEQSMIWAGIAAKLCGIPTVLTFHRSILHYYQPNRVNRLLLRLTKRFIAVSEQRRQLLIKNLGIDQQRCLVNHGGIDTQIMPIGKAEARKRLSLPPEQLILFSAGHLGEIKGHQDTLQALKEIGDVHKTQLYIAGSGSDIEYAAIHRLRDELGLQQKVHFLGQIDNAQLWMEAADVFVQPSLEEAFGLVFIEAGLHKLPVVATNIGGIPDIVVDGETGYLVPPANPKALADALSQLIVSSKLREQFGVAANQRIRSKFDKQHMINNYLDSFNQLLTEA